MTDHTWCDKQLPSFYLYFLQDLQQLLWGIWSIWLCIAYFICPVCLLIFIHSKSVYVTERWNILVYGEVECCKKLWIVVFSLLPVDHKSCLTFRYFGPSSFFLFCFKTEENRAVLPLKRYSYTYITMRALKAVQSQTHTVFLFNCIFVLLEKTLTLFTVSKVFI